MHYREDGDPNAPLLVLLHGFADSFTTWDGWVRELKPQFHIISLDFPGHGLTRAPAGSFLGGDELADFIDAFAAKLTLPKFAVAGNSMGGGAAWELAVRHPDRVNALILVDAAGFANDKPGKQPLGFVILRYRLGRTVLSKIDNRPLIEQGLKADVYDKSLITPFIVDRFAEFQRAPGHREILMGVNMGGRARLDRGTAVDHQGSHLDFVGRERPAHRAWRGEKICGGDQRIEIDHLPRSRALAAARDSAALGGGRRGLLEGQSSRRAARRLSLAAHPGCYPAPVSCRAMQRDYLGNPITGERDGTLRAHR